MKECCGNKFILNGSLMPVSEFDEDLVYRGETIYEVIRMVAGTPVFFDDHAERLESGVRLQKKNMIAARTSLKESIILLASAEKKKEINIKIVFNYHEEKENWLVYYIDSTYPSEEQYRKGVKGILFYGERHDPQAKVLDYRLRSAIHRELAGEGAYEALLVNEDNLITEGSRSNIFFLSGDRLVTAPDEMILKGITRKHILEICREKGIDIDFRCADADEIGGFRSAFLTGTSPMLLPFSFIDDVVFDVSDPLLGDLRRSYMERVEKSLEAFRRK